MNMHAFSGKYDGDIEIVSANFIVTGAVNAMVAGDNKAAKEFSVMHGVKQLMGGQKQDFGATQEGPQSVRNTANPDKGGMSI